MNKKEEFVYLLGHKESPAELLKIPFEIKIKHTVTHICFSIFSKSYEMVSPERKEAVLFIVYGELGVTRCPVNRKWSEVNTRSFERSHCLVLDFNTRSIFLVGIERVPFLVTVDEKGVVSAEPLNPPPKK